MTRGHFRLLTGLVFLLCFSQVHAGNTDAFEAANRLYEQGRYREAVAAYSNMVATGTVSAAVYFNLGNACFKAGQLGRAIAAYRHAQALAPRDPDIRANLEFARKAASGREETSSAGWQDWLRRLSLNEWTLLGCAAFWGWLGLLTILQFRPDWRRFLGNWAAFCLGIFLAVSFCLGIQLYDLKTAKTAVVISGPVQARLGPFEDSRPAFTCNDGMELAMLGVKGEWVEVRDNLQRLGWLKKDFVQVLPGQP